METTWLSTGEAARLSGISKSRIQNLVDARVLPGCRVGINRRIRLEDLFVYLVKRGMPCPEVRARLAWRTPAALVCLCRPFEPAAWAALSEDVTPVESFFHLSALVQRREFQVYVLDWAQLGSNTLLAVDEIRKLPWASLVGCLTPADDGECPERWHGRGEVVRWPQDTQMTQVIADLAERYFRPGSAGGGKERAGG